MRVLTMTSLYPNAAMPAHGIFVENRLSAFIEQSGAQAKVVAPVPWFPTGAKAAGRYGAFARAPKVEIRRGIEVRHPRYFLPPRIGMTYAVHALERVFYDAATELIEEGFDFDLIDAHYLYPDGVAALRVARRLGKPVVLTARGSDVTLYPRYPRQRRMIVDAVLKADAVICVAQALKDELAGLGAPLEKIIVLRNGVDLERFSPRDRGAARAALGVTGFVVVSVGHLIVRKGHDLVIDALAEFPQATLLIVGEGPERASLQSLARQAGVESRVKFLGAVAHERLADIYSAADALVLASSREGWPNVLLEAMACGTPVVATPVHGSVEAVAAPEAGKLARARSAAAIADSLRELAGAAPDRAATRRYAEGFSWNETAQGLERVFHDAIDRSQRKRAVATRRVAVAPSPAPRLIVTVDTEEIFDWSRFEAASHRLAPVKDIDLFQQLAASFGVRPVYFLTYPLIDDPDTAEYFRELRAVGAADLGLHPHTWTTPPFGGFAGEYYSWQCNLPDAVLRDKLDALADRFEAEFGFRARAHRAGRYGVSRADYPELARIGVDLDFSPSPGFDFSFLGGPDFSAMRNEPFRVETGGGQIFVTPVCGARALRGGRIFLSAPAGAPGFDGAPSRRPRGLLAPMRLTCEGATTADLVALTRRLVRDGTPVLTFSLHSTSLTPGATAYAPDAAATSILLETCRDYFEYWRNALGGAFLSLDDLAALYGLPADASNRVNAPLRAGGAI